MIYHFDVYIITNPRKVVLYTGLTNALAQRITEHFLNRGKPKTFAGRYYCYNLLYYQGFKDIYDAIERENRIKGWTRAKKIALINEFNPSWEILNSAIMEWPPVNRYVRGQDSD